MNYGSLTLFLYELSTIILDPIELPSYDTFPIFVSQMDSQRREIFFSIFALILGGYKCHFSDLKWGQKWKTKISLFVDCPFD